MTLKKEKYKIGVFNRLNLDKENFIKSGAKLQDDLVRKKLANELKPAQIKNSINKVDKAFSDLLGVGKEIE